MTRAAAVAPFRAVRAIGTVLPVLAVLAVLAPGARANPADAFGFGARAVGLGGAYGALADGFEANYYNPAGLATSGDLRLELGYLHISPRLFLSGADLEVDRVSGVLGGVTLPGEVFDRRFALSVGLYLPDARLTRIRALPERQPRFALYDNRPQRIVLTTSVAFEVVPDLLFLGAGLTYLSDTRGRLRVSGQVDIQDAGGTHLVSAVDVNFEAVRYPSASVLLTPGEHLRLALTYRDAFDLELDIGLIVEGDLVLAGASPHPTVVVEDALLEVLSTNTNLFSPRQLALSAAWQEARWAAALELVWQQWSGFRSPTARIRVALDVGDLPLDVPAPPLPQEPGFHDILVTRLGGEVLVHDSRHFGLTLRAGYFWEPSPAPDQPARTNYVDSDKHGFSLGLGLRLSDLGAALPKPLHLDVAGLFVHLPRRHYRKDDPADPIGDYVASGHFIGFTTTMRLDF